MTVIAIDGPAAAGKGTLARALSRHYKFAYLDTGALYRAVALAVLRAGDDPEDENAALQRAVNLELNLLMDRDLREERVGETASKVAAFPSVREALIEIQRDFAECPPRKKAGAVLDGRDIGTVIWPAAEAKLYVTASAEVRANRRLKDEQVKGRSVSYETILADVETRDARDSGRASAPLRRDADAYLLDTTDLSIEAAFEQAVAYIDKCLAKG